MKILLISILYSQIVWGPEISLTPGNDSMGIYYPRATVWKDTIHLVFLGSYSPNQYDIFYMRSVDRGETWEGPKNLTINDPDEATFPWITAWGNKVHVVYQRKNDSIWIIHMKSNDGGNTWGNPKKLLNNAVFPKIVCAKDTLYVISPAPGLNKEFYFLKSYDSGNSWILQVIDTIFAGRRLCLYSNYLHIIGGKRQENEVYYLRSPDLGNTWEGPFVISPVDNWPSQLPSLAVSDSNVYIPWMESMGCSFGAWYNVNLRKSSDNGNNFSNREILSNLCRSHYNDIYAKDSIVLIVYTDERDNPGQWEFELYWRASYDYGNNWTPEERLTYIPGEALWPALTGWGNNIYLFWSEWEYSIGLVELYFKKATLVNIKEKQYKETQNEEIKFLFSNILFLPYKIKFFVKNGEKYSLNLFNLNGQKLKILKEGIGKGKEEIILDKIGPGNYFLILETKDKILKKKILILEGGER